MFPTGFPTPEFCCSILCQEILLLWTRNGKAFGLRVKRLHVGGAQRCNSSVCQLGQWTLSCFLQEPRELLDCMPRVYLPWKRESKQDCISGHGSHHSMGRDAVRGHSQTWEFGSTPRFPYTVRALLSEGQNYFTDSRKHLGRKSEDKQYEVCECKHFPALPAAFQQTRKGHGEQWALYPILKILHGIITQYFSFLCSTRIQRKMSGLIKEVELLPPKVQIAEESATQEKNRRSESQKREMNEVSAHLFCHKTLRGSDKTSEQQV